MMRRTTVLAAALLAGGVMTTGAQARVGGGGGGHGIVAHGFRGGLQPRSVFPNDPALAEPPPQQQQRSFVGPAPSLGTPMQRVAPVAPLASPPLR